MPNEILSTLFSNGLLHGGDFNPDQWKHDANVLEEDVRLMQKCGCNTFSIGIFAWAALEPEEGRYDFSWLDRAIDRLHSASRRVILATPSGARPFWMAQKYPEILRMTREGKRVSLGGRHNHCWTSPVYRDKVKRINTQLAQRYSKHPAVVLWHLSNEYNGECVCPLCTARFHGWLRDRYGSLERLNRAWWSAFWSHTYSDWSQIDPTNGSLDGLIVDWRRFTSEQIAEFAGWEAIPLREANPGLPVTTNLMGFHFGVNYRRLATVLDVVSDDFYPGYNAEDPNLPVSAATSSMRFDMMRCLKGKPMPWFLMESCIDGRQLWSNVKLKPPGLHDLEMFQSIAHGSSGTLYFQWRQNRGGVEKFHGAVVHHAHPEETRSFKEVTALSGRYARLGEITSTLNRSDVALILDWETRWAYNAALGMPDFRNEYRLVADAAAHYLPFWSRGISVDVLGDGDDFSSYKLVIAPKLFMLKRGVAERLKAFVARGGTLVLTHMSGAVDETGLCFTDGAPGDGLEELAGVFVDETDQMVRETDSIGVRATGSDNAQWRTTRVYSVGNLMGASVLAEYTESWAGGQPALTVKQTGKGSTYFFLADFDQAGYERAYARIIEAAGLAGVCGNREPLPSGVTAQRRYGSKGDYLVLLNFSKVTTEVEVAGSWQDAETGEAAGRKVGVKAFGARVLRGGGGT